MKKLFTLAAAVLASFSLAWAQTEIFSFTATSSTTAIGTYPATNGSAVLSGSAHSTGGSNEITVDNQTYYKFNSSTKWTFTLTEGTFAVDDVITLKGACGTSDKSGKGFKLAGSITVTGNFPKNTANTLTYTIQENDGIAGKSSFTLERNDSDIKFGTITVTRQAAETNPVASVTIEGPTKGTKDYAFTYTATTDVKADAYQWFVNDVAQNEAVGKTFTFTPTAIGDYSIVCKARNANNASDEWIASSPIVFQVYSSLFGEIIKATLTSGSAATVTGLIGGTADVSLSSSKKMDKGKYFGITLASGAFAEGDTVVVTLSAAGQNYPCLFADKNKTTLLYLATETSSDLEYKIILPAAATGKTSLYFARDANDEVYKWNPTFNSVAVVRPMPVKSTVETLKTVSINDYPIAAADLVTLQTEHTLNLEDSVYVTAPVVKFTKHVVVTYEDESTKEKDEVIEKTSQQAQAGMWGAMVDIAGVAYSVYTVKATSYTVTYKEGEQVLGTELVAANGSPAKYAQYEKKPLFSFDGWYKDAALTQAVASIQNEVISADVAFYAKFSTAYAKSINIEQIVLDNGTKYDIKSALIDAGYAYSNIDALDSLNDVDKKDNRNYAFLGLKIKKAGAYITFNLKAGDSIAVKFGNCPDTLYSVVGTDTAYIAKNTAVYSHKAGATDEVVKLVTIKGSTLVLKQIMVNDTIAEVELPDPSAYAITVTAENGKLDVAWAGKKQDIAKVNALVGATVTLTATPDEGYKLVDIKVNGEALEPVEGVYSFVMPAEAVAIVATFESDGTAIDNAATTTKAVKVLREGVLFIEKNGVRYNAQGAVVR